MIVNVSEAKAKLSALLAAVERGEEVIIARYGKPIVRLVALEPPPKRQLGFFPIDLADDLIAPTSEDVLVVFDQH
jgi:prevent-host-death family protein